MNFVRFTTSNGRNYDVPVDFPAELDPRFDFVKSDADLIEITRKRLAYAAGELAEASVESGLLFDVQDFSIVAFDVEPMDLIDNPPTVARGA